jgi:hypothetical protein
VALAKLANLVLPYFTSNNLLCKVFNHLASWRDPAVGKTINLINQDLLLGIGKTLVLVRLELLSGGGFASSASRQRCTD